VGNKGNRRGEGNRGLVYYYEDGDSNGNGNVDCLRGKGVGQGEERGNGRMCLFLFIVFIFDGGEEDCFMLSYFVIVFCVSPFSMQVDRFCIKFKSIVGWLSLARFLFQSILSKERSKDLKIKSGASSVSRSGTLEETLCLEIMSLV
jgi:hypothetical protein